MTLLMFLPAALAFGGSNDAIADTGGCRGTRVSEVRPTSGTDDMPTDGLLRIAVQTDGCGGDGLDIEVDSDLDESWSETLTVDGDTGVASWLPDGGWTPGATYTVRIWDDLTQDSDDEPRTVSFTAGDEPADTIAAPPVLTLYEAWADETRDDEAVVDVDLHVSSQSDPLGLTLVQVFLQDDAIEPLATKFGTGTGELEIALATLADVSGGEICLVGLHTDAAGEASELGEPVCADIQWRPDTSTGCGGCSSGVGVMGAGFVWCFVACLIAVRREEQG